MLTFAVVWLPIVLSLFAMFRNFHNYFFPVFSTKFIILAVISLTPSILLLTFNKFNIKKKKALKTVLTVLCVFSIVISPFITSCIVTKSETTEITDYGNYDVACVFNGSSVISEIFPGYPPHYFENVKGDDGRDEAVYLDAHYYYCFKYGWENTADIYLECPYLYEENEYTIEKNRVSFIMEHNTFGHKRVEVDKGDYHCYILYSGDEP
ncbi:MAG: hypothetical protein IJL87_01800, partial [Clostridia bacterium]|nr:hypothetical protein [Clostridia bacterium]